jgi:hypothetical protein
METYKNLGGDSNVSAYEISDDSITVRFKDGGTYLYNYKSAGPEMIEKMKNLALVGQGLNTFINRYARDAYSAKLAEKK